jgi:hypothetical protein
MALRYGCVLIALIFVVGVDTAEAQCSATVTPTTVSVSSIGSTSSLSVVSGTSCTWTAVSSVAWITVTSATGAGIGQVNYTVAANSTGIARTGTMAVAGQTVTFTQAASSCSYSVTPTSVSVPSTGSTSAFSVVTGTSCTWTPVSSVAWITITSATGSGIGQVNYTVAPNTTGLQRIGTITVGGVTVTFTQAASSCTYSVTPTSVSVPSIGSTSAFSVTSGTSCTWTAVSSVSWITVTSATGAGIGQVNYTVAANTTGLQRIGTITVAGQAVTFTQAATSCTYSITPTTVTAPPAGNAYTVSVTTGASCSWSASTAASWITITAGATGIGVGSVSFTVAGTSTSRIGAVTIAGQGVTVTQSAPTPPAPPSNLRVIR